mmetsp:Transcript_54978/g.129090  ORF Transcript_54978/g.129090 Transcript_54978/m.129090 type:complete len:210 (-) Transcript_54978:26-655(-)
MDVRCTHLSHGMPGLVLLALHIIHEDLPAGSTLVLVSFPLSKLFLLLLLSFAPLFGLFLVALLVRFGNLVGRLGRSRGCSRPLYVIRIFGVVVCLDDHLERFLGFVQLALVRVDKDSEPPVSFGDLVLAGFLGDLENVVGGAISLLGIIDLGQHPFDDLFRGARRAFDLFHLRGLDVGDLIHEAVEECVHAIPIIHGCSSTGVAGHRRY